MTASVHRARLGAFVGDAPRRAVGGLDELGAIAEPRAATRGGAHGRIRIDPSLARGLSYYTGAIMEIAVPDLAGSLGGGGRYDNLVGMFLGRDVPACGFSLGLERIIVVMTERGMFPPTGVRARGRHGHDLECRARAATRCALARELRRGRLRVDVYPEADKLGKQFKYASGRNVPLVADPRRRRAAAANVAVKDLRSGEQASVPRAEAAAHVRRHGETRRTGARTRGRRRVLTIGE